MNKQKRKGFTIVELVIVIAVIAILSAVLIPTFGGVVDNANKTADLQSARNKYVQYVGNSENGIFSDDVIVEVNDKFYAVVDGEVKSTIYGTLDAAKAAFTGACVSVAAADANDVSVVKIAEAHTPTAEGALSESNPCKDCGAKA